jgi:hypothetical protein
MEMNIVNASEFGIEESKAGELMGNLPQIKDERSVFESQFKEILTLDIEDISTSKKARELRLKIKENRTKGIEVWHKNAKEFFLKGGQFVDAIKRMESSINTRMEDSLEEIEKYFEIKEANRKTKLSNDRILELQKYYEFVPMGINFGEISEEEYSKIFNGAKLQYEAKVEQERIAEEQRVAAEKAELARIAEEKRIQEEKIEAQRIENERLRKEADEREAAAEKERKEQAELLAKQQAEADAKIQAEREAREKAETEIRLKKEAEEAAEQQRLRDEETSRKELERLAKAPIKKQLAVWVNSFYAPESPVKNEVSELISQKFDAFKKWAQDEIEKL